MTIRKITTYVFVGSDADLPTLKTTPAIVHAAKEPWHRKAVGYVTRGAPKESPEYLYAVRHYYSELCLNLVDVGDVSYVPKVLMDAAVNFVNYHRCKHRNVFIHCNQGRSRAPTIGMLVIAPNLSPHFKEAIAQFLDIYPEYDPGMGMYDFAEQNWEFYHANSSDQRNDENPGQESGIYWPPGEGRAVLGQCDESPMSLAGDRLDTVSGGAETPESGSERRDTAPIDETPSDFGDGGESS